MSLVEKKHHLFGTKKIPLFVYCGPEPDGLYNYLKIFKNIKIIF